MFAVRQVRENDLDALERFSHGTVLGMLSLPKDRSLLKKRIDRSLESFAKNVRSPKDELYLFILEDIDSGEAVGSSGIYAKTGVNSPLYYYRLETITAKEEGLPLPKETKVLQPVLESNGPSELCSLYLEKKFRKEGLGELLSLSRFLYLSQHMHRFDTTVAARLRGCIDRKTLTSPFWDGLGRHFLKVSFKEAQAMQQRGTEFISKFIPKYPIYVSLLPKKTQNVIQRPHSRTIPALVMLKKEGFALIDQIDLFEGGPVVSAKTKEIRSIKEHREAVIERIADTLLDSTQYIVSNTSVDFRACYSRLKLTPEQTVIVPQETASILKVKTGQKVRYITTHKL